MAESPTRRAAIKKTAVATAAAGVAWTAPRVSGLSMRPHYAGAQTGGGDTGASFDVSVSASASASFASTTVLSPVPGLSLAFGQWQITDTINHALGLIRGSLAAINCFVNSLDATQSDGTIGMGISSELLVPGLSHILDRSINSVNGNGTITVRVHISCT